MEAYNGLIIKTLFWTDLNESDILKSIHKKGFSVMSRKKRRNFSAKFKSDLVIELLKGEKDLNISNRKQYSTKSSP